MHMKNLLIEIWRAGRRLVCRSRTPDTGTSTTRKYLASMENSEECSDHEYVYEEWDIPFDERITAYEANMWLHGQIYANEEIVPTEVMEGMDSDEWDDAVEFVWKCLRHGVAPHEYVHTLINRQQIYNDLVQGRC